MRLKIIQNPNDEIRNKIIQALKDNSGYCPCLIDKNDDTKCMCKSFREQDSIGPCHCNLYIKIKVEE